MSVITSDTIDYQSKAVSHSTYRSTRVLAYNGQGVTLSVSAPVTSEFELPSKVYNLSRSTLRARVRIPEVNSSFTNIIMGGATMIDSVQLYNKGGQYLADVQNVAQFTRAIAPYVNKRSEFMSRSNCRGAITEALLVSGSKSAGSQFFPSNVAVPTATPGAALAPNGTRLSGGLAVAPDAGLSEQCYFLQGPVGDGSGGGDVFFDLAMPLSEIYHSLLSVDKSLYLGNDNVILRVNWAAANRIFFTSTSATVLSTGYAVAVTAPVISKLRLDLMLETNNAVSASLIQKVNSAGGFSMPVPWVQSSIRNTGSTGTSYNSQERYNSTVGKRLLNIYHVLSANASSGSQTFDNGNLAESKLVSYQSYLDNLPIQESVQLSADNEPYEKDKDKLDESVIASANIYKFNQVLIDSWRGGKTTDWLAMDTMVDGLDLSTEKLWSIAATTASAQFYHATFAVLQRMLVVTTNGPQIL